VVSIFGIDIGVGVGVGNELIRLSVATDRVLDDGSRDLGGM